MADRKTSSPKATEEKNGTWRALPWRKLEQHVYRMQKRIYRASQRGNKRQVEKLQKLFLKSEAARLLAVRRVTQDNQGKKTAGVDGVKSVSPKERFLMVKQLHSKHWKHRKYPKPVRRVWIPKPGKVERRPLGIPTMMERAKQALVKLALEPVWEAVFEPNSYGFRPGRSCHDAIGAIFLGIRYKPILIRYADDFVILHSDKTELQKAANRTAQWLKDMRLRLSPSKTRITHTLNLGEENVGFDFLGFHVQQYRVGKTHTRKDTHGRSLGYKTLIRPSKEAVKRHTREIGQRLRKLRNAPQESVINELNPVIRGWCNYYRWVRCSEVFETCDQNTYQQLIRWSNARQHGKGKRQAGRKYHIRIDTRTRFGTYIKDKVGNPTPIYVRHHADTHSQDYVKVKGTASPYDGNLLYWAKRLKQHPLVTNEKAKLLKIQQWQCPRCGLYFKDGDLLEVDHSIPTALGGKDDLGNKWVYHRHCHDEKTAEDMAYIAKRKAEGVSNR